MDLLLAHAASTWAPVGLIWMIQVVQYPGFAKVGTSEFAAFHQHHASRISVLVAVLMGTELLTGILLLADPPNGIPSASLWFGMSLIGLNWAATAFVSMPLHARLSGRDRTAERALTRTNWIRTVAWTVRGLWIVSVLRTVLSV